MPVPVPEPVPEPEPEPVPVPVPVRSIAASLASICEAGHLQDSLYTPANLASLCYR